MAPVSKLTAVSLRKPLLYQIWARHQSLPLAVPILRRSFHASMYDKNFDEKIRTSFVPDEVVKLLSDKYWAPHPQTGVFGPQSAHDVTLRPQYTNAEAGVVAKARPWIRRLGFDTPAWRTWRSTTPTSHGEDRLQLLLCSFVKNLLPS